MDIFKNIDELELNPEFKDILINNTQYDEPTNSVKIDVNAIMQTVIGEENNPSDDNIDKWLTGVESFARNVMDTLWSSITGPIMRILASANDDHNIVYKTMSIDHIKKLVEADLFYSTGPIDIYIEGHSFLNLYDYHPNGFSLLMSTSGRNFIMNPEKTQLYCDAILCTPPPETTISPAKCVELIKTPDGFCVDLSFCVNSKSSKHCLEDIYTNTINTCPADMPFDKIMNAEDLQNLLMDTIKKLNTLPMENLLAYGKPNNFFPDIIPELVIEHLVKMKKIIKIDSIFYTPEKRFIFDQSKTYRNLNDILNDKTFKITGTEKITNVDEFLKTIGI